MSHGKRMLEAQAQKSRASGTRDDSGRVDDGHLRNVSRAFNDDGTPLRPSRHSARRPDDDLSNDNVDETSRTGSYARRGLREMEDATATSSPPPRLSGLGSSGNSRSGRGTEESAPRRNDERLVGEAAAGPRLGFGPMLTRSSSAVKPTVARPINVDAESHSDGDTEDPNSPANLTTSTTAAATKVSNAVADSLLTRGAKEMKEAEAEELRISSRSYRANQKETKKSRQRSPLRGSAPRYPTDRIRLSGTNPATLSPSPTTTRNAPGADGAKLSPAPALSSSHPRPPQVTLTPAHTATTTTTTRQPSSSSTLSSPGSTVSVRVHPSSEEREADRSPSPPPMTRNTATQARLHATPQPVTAALRPPPTPATSSSALVTAAASVDDTTTSSSALFTAAAAASTSSAPTLAAEGDGQQRPSPLPLSELSSTSSAAGKSSSGVVHSPTPPLLPPMSPASPPLRAGVSPRMTARHPTRFDATGSRGAFSASSRAASASSSSCITIAPSLSSSQVGHVVPSSSSSPPQQQGGVRPLTSPSSIAPQEPLLSSRLPIPAEKKDSVIAEDLDWEDVKLQSRGEQDGLASRLDGASPNVSAAAAAAAAVGAVGEDRWQSIPPSPLPSPNPNEQSGVHLPPPPLSPQTLPPPLHDSGDHFPPAAAAADDDHLQFSHPLKQYPQQEQAQEQETSSYFDFEDAPYLQFSPLTNSADKVNYPYVRDYSGFHNSGNDCYGCSALTMLLRSPVFRHALSSSPLVVAARRFDAYNNGKAEKKVPWTSGYLDTVRASKRQESASQDKKAKKRARAEAVTETEESTVADVCGLPTPLPTTVASALTSTGVQAGIPADSSTAAATSGAAHKGGDDGGGVVEQEVRQPADCAFAFTPTPAVQATQRFVESMDIDELEAALDVDSETGRAPSTLHAALMQLVRSQRWREHLTSVINATDTPAAERQRLVEFKLYHPNDRAYEGQVYTCGIRLNAVASLFEGEFFLGEQEDAHELFVALMAKLESEAVEFQKRCAAVFATRHAAEGHDEETETEGRLRAEEENEEGQEDGQHGCPAKRRKSEGPSAVLGGSSSSLVITGARPSPISTAIADAWINALVQTRLLNIIRCRSPGCRHEIVTDEICVNLSLHIPDEEDEGNAHVHATTVEAQRAGKVVPPPTTQRAAEEERAEEGEAEEDFSFFPSQAVSDSAGAGTAAVLPSPPPQPIRCTVASLLHASMAYEALSDYRCDACGLKSSQYQGGCFYTRPPPLLVLQLKRFSTDFVNGTLRIQKNSRSVEVEEELVIYALPSLEELQQKPPRHRLRTVTLSDLKAERSGACHWSTTALDQQAMENPGGATQDRCFLYDAEKKCFTCPDSTGSASAKPAGASIRELDVTDQLHHQHDEEEEAAAAADAADATAESPSPTTALAEMDSADVYVCALRTVYRLRSCVLHLGRSLHFGHYVADFAVDGEETPLTEMNTSNHNSSSRRLHNALVETVDGVSGQKKSAVEETHAPSRRWRRANDERVDVMSEEAVRTRSTGRADTYLLLYEKIAEEWVRCPLCAVLPKPVYPAEAQKDAGTGED
uniref:ubiquitinyl hydrolase 1 n=1 Tax=Angomonas deanei TaxID=59799 RepID=C6K3R2_9TRYP|nr:putative ubiquitin hydrolase [Angomonas deanei]